VTLVNLYQITCLHVHLLQIMVRDITSNTPHIISIKVILLYIHFFFTEHVNVVTRLRFHEVLTISRITVRFLSRYSLSRT
jgi:hypothetical protein